MLFFVACDLWLERELAIDEWDIYLSNRYSSFSKYRISVENLVAS